MARKPLSEEEKAAKAAEKAEQLATRGKRVRKTERVIEQSSMQENSQNPENTGNTQNDQTQDTGTTTPPAVRQNEPQKTPSSQSTQPSKSTNPSAHHQPDTQFSPLGGNKVSRTYSKPVIDPALANTVIPEANIQTESISTEKAQEMMKNASQGADNTPVIPPVEGFSNLTPNEKQLAAEKTADLVLGAYDRLHWLGRKFVTVDMEDLADDHRRGEINQNLVAFDDEEDPNGGITIKEYFEDFNGQVEEEFTVTEDFKNAVRPPLERVCLKRGWGASDEMYLLFKFGEDMAMKAGMLVGFKKLTNRYMQEFKDDHAKHKAAVAEGVRKELAKKAARDKSMAEAAEKAAAEKAAIEAAEKNAADNADLEKTA